MMQPLSGENFKIYDHSRRRLSALRRAADETPPAPNPLLTHYEAAHKALNEFRPTSDDDWVAVRLSALSLLLSYHPSKFRAADETPALLAMGDPIPEGGCGCRDNGVPIMRANCRLHGATAKSSVLRDE